MQMLTIIKLSKYGGMQSTSMQVIIQLYERDIDECAASLTVFKKQLKTYLFTLQ